MVCIRTHNFSGCWFYWECDWNLKLRRWSSNCDAFSYRTLPPSGITLLLCVWGLSSVGQRAGKGLSLQQCWEIPRKDNAAPLNRGPSNNNNRHRGGGVMLADGNGSRCEQRARIKTQPWLKEQFTEELKMCLELRSKTTLQHSTTEAHEYLL